MRGHVLEPWLEVLEALADLTLQGAAEADEMRRKFEGIALDVQVVAPAAVQCIEPGAPASAFRPRLVPAMESGGREACTLDNCGHMRQLDAIVELLGMPRGGRSVLDELRARGFRAAADPPRLVPLAPMPMVGERAYDVRRRFEAPPEVQIQHCGGSLCSVGLPTEAEPVRRVCVCDCVVCSASRYVREMHDAGYRFVWKDHELVRQAFAWLGEALEWLTVWNAAPRPGRGQLGASSGLEAHAKDLPERCNVPGCKLARGGWRAAHLIESWSNVEPIDGPRRDQNARDFARPWTAGQSRPLPELKGFALSWPDGSPPPQPGNELAPVPLGVSQREMLQRGEGVHIELAKAYDVVRYFGEGPPQPDREGVAAERGPLGGGDVQDAADDAHEQGQDDRDHGPRMPHDCDNCPTPPEPPGGWCAVYGCLRGQGAAFHSCARCGKAMP